MPAASSFCAQLLDVAARSRRLRPVPSGWPSTARAGRIRAGSARAGPAPATGSGRAVRAARARASGGGGPRCRRTRPSGCSSSCWRSAGLREGRLPATKSASRPGSVIWLRQRPGRRRDWARPTTICWNRLTTFRRSASISGVSSGSISGMRSTRARRNGSVAVYLEVRMRAMPSQNSSRFSLGTRMALCITHTVPTSYRSSGSGASTRGSTCETTPSMRFSPSDCTSATELGRPTVMGSKPRGKSTVSRTVRIGSSSTVVSAICDGGVCSSIFSSTGILT